MKLGKKIVIGVLGVPLGLVLVLVAAGMIMSTCSSMKAKATAKEVKQALAAVQKAQQGGDATAIKAAEEKLQKYIPPQTHFTYELIKKGDYAGGIHITKYYGPITEYSVLVYPAEIEGNPVRWISGDRTPSEALTWSSTRTTTEKEKKKVTLKDKYGNTTTGTIEGEEKKVKVRESHSKSEYYLDTVVIPEGVRRIDSFGGNDSWSSSDKYRINSISLPSTLETIDNKTFYWCEIQSIDMSQCASLTTIGDEAFKYSITSINLQTIQLPDSVTEIGKEAFLACHGLTSVNLPASIKSIGGQAFSYCRALTKLSIPESLTAVEFGDNAFSDCRKLPSATRQRLQALGYTGSF